LENGNTFDTTAIQKIGGVDTAGNFTYVTTVGWDGVTRISVPFTQTTAVGDSAYSTGLEFTGDGYAIDDVAIGVMIPVPRRALLLGVVGPLGLALTSPLDFGARCGSFQDEVHAPC